MTEFKTQFGKRKWKNGKFPICFSFPDGIENNDEFIEALADMKGSKKLQEWFNTIFALSVKDIDSTCPQVDVTEFCRLVTKTAKVFTK